MEEKKPLYKRWWFWAIAIFILFILIAAASGGGADTSSVPTNGDNQPNGTTEEEVTYTLGDKVRVGDVRWMVTDAYTDTSLEGAFGDTETTQGKFVVVNVTVENLGKDMKTMSNLTLIDSQGREYTSSSNSFESLGAEQLYILENLNPNLPYTFADVYEVPADAEEFKLTVGDLELLGNDEAQIGLGF